MSDLLEFRLNILDICAIVIAIISIIISILISIYVSKVHDSNLITHGHLEDIKDILKDNNV